MYEISTKQLREQREFESMYKNPKHARSMWAQKVFDRWSAPATPPCIILDKDGNMTPQSQIEQHVWNTLLKELKAKGLDRMPTNGEMTEACQDYYSRHNSSAYVARRDSMGAKPVDETKQEHTTTNPLEGMSDEELLVMQRALEEYRSKAKLEYNEKEEKEDE